MRTIEAYQSSDGKLFTNECECVKHQDDIIGAEIDGLLMMFDLDISRNQQFKAVLCVMKKRDALKTAIRELLAHLTHGDDQS